MIKDYNAKLDSFNTQTNKAIEEGLKPAPDASPTEKGVVLQGVAVTDATDGTDVITNFNALLTSLRDAGVIAT